MTGAERIAAERQRQIEVEGWTAEHDAVHTMGELAAAAAAYANWSDAYDIPGDTAPPCWPWDSENWNPSLDDIRNLEKAGALIAAEIDRLLAERT